MRKREAEFMHLLVYFNPEAVESMQISMRINLLGGRSQLPRGLRRRSAAARLLGLWVRIPPASWKFVCCDCHVLSGRDLCVGLITRPEEAYRLWCIVVCDLETL